MTHPTLRSVCLLASYEAALHPAAFNCAVPRGKPSRAACTAIDRAGGFNRPPGQEQCTMQYEPDQRLRPNRRGIERATGSELPLLAAVAFGQRIEVGIR